MVAAEHHRESADRDDIGKPVVSAKEGLFHIPRHYGDVAVVHKPEMIEKHEISVDLGKKSPAVTKRVEDGLTAHRGRAPVGPGAVVDAPVRSWISQRRRVGNGIQQLHAFVGQPEEDDVCPGQVLRANRQRSLHERGNVAPKNGGHRALGPARLPRGPVCRPSPSGLHILGVHASSSASSSPRLARRPRMPYKYCPPRDPFVGH